MLSLTEKNYQCTCWYDCVDVDQYLVKTSYCICYTEVVFSISGFTLYSSLKYMKLSVFILLPITTSSSWHTVMGFSQWMLLQFFCKDALMSFCYSLRNSIGKVFYLQSPGSGVWAPEEAHVLCDNLALKKPLSLRG